MLFIQLIDGYVDPDTLDITVAPIIALVYIGIIDGNMKDGVNVKLNLSQAKGELRSYLKNGNEVWIYMDVAIVLTGITRTTLSSWSFDARVSNQHLVRSTSF